MKGKITTGILVLYTILALLFFSGYAEARYTGQCVRALPEVAVKVKTLYLPVPEITGNPVYSGEILRPELVCPEGTEGLFEILGTAEAVQAGTYELVLRLTDPEGTAWSDGSTEDRVLIWYVLPRSVPKPSLSERTRIYSGATQAPIVTGLEEGAVTTEGMREASAAGVYSVTFSLADPQNTCWEDGGNASFSEEWGVYVCHIGTLYFTSVQAAFETNSSTTAAPVVLDCDWTESPVNAGGTNVFDLNQKTLQGTVENRGTLTIYGGTVKRTLSGDAYALRNAGTLTVSGGTYEAVSTASATSGKEAWAVYNTGGTAMLSGCTLKASGANTAVCGYQVSGGTVTSSAAVSVTSNASTHGAYYAYVSGGTLNVNGGSSTVTNTVGFTYLFQTAGGTVNVSGGTHTGSAAKNGNAYLATSGTIRVTGGSSTITAKTDCNAANANGGTITISSGTHTALSSGGKEARGLLRSTGQITMSGGTVRAGTSGTGYGAANTTADTTQSKLQVTGGSLYVKAGTAYCVLGGVTNAWIKLTSSVKFYIYYRSAHSCGSYYTGSAPRHSVLTTTSVFTYALSGREDTVDFGILTVDGGVLYLGGCCDTDEVLLLENVADGRWHAELIAENGESTGIRLWREEVAEDLYDSDVRPEILNGGSGIPSVDDGGINSRYTRLTFTPSSLVLSLLGALPETGFSYDVVCGFRVPDALEADRYIGLMLPMAGLVPVEVLQSPQEIRIRAVLSDGAYLGALYHAMLESGEEEYAYGFEDVEE